MKKLIVILSLLLGCNFYCLSQKDTADFNCNDTVNVVVLRFSGFNKVVHLYNAYYKGGNTFIISRCKKKHNLSFRKVISGLSNPECYIGAYYVLRTHKGLICAEGDWYVDEDTFLTKGFEYYRNGNIKMSFTNNVDSAIWIYYKRNGELIKTETIK